MKNWTGLAAVAVIVLAGTSALAATTKLLRIAEDRERTVAGGPESQVHSTMHVFFWVTGADVRTATHYGYVKVRQAIDDLGTSLVLPESPPARDLRWIEGAKQGGFRVSFTLRAAPRRATKLRVMKGSFKVMAGGKPEVVKIADPKRLIGKSIVDSTLKAVGVQVRLVEADTFGFSLTDDPAKHPEMRAILKGHVEAVQSIVIADKRGMTVGIFADIGAPDGSLAVLQRPLTKDMQLQIKVMVGQKPIEIPVELHDIVLP